MLRLFIRLHENIINPDAASVCTQSSLTSLVGKESTVTAILICK